MRWILLTALMLSLTAIAWAGEASATANLITTGTVWTNSVALPSGSTIRSGDRIKTGSAGTALVLSPTTGLIEVRRNSEVTFTAARLTLHNGVVSTGHLPVRLGDFEMQVKDPNPQALVVVANRDGKQLVAAHRGDALITGAGLVPVLVPAGSYAVSAGGPADKSKSGTTTKEEDDDDGRPADESGTTTKEDDDDDDAGAAGAAGAGGAGGAAVPAAAGKAAEIGWTIGSLTHQASVALVAGVGAAAAGGTIAGIALTGDSTSPSN